MEEKLRRAKERYDAIEIPEELGSAVQDAIRRGRLKRDRWRFSPGKIASCVAACACAVFMVTMNAFPVLAMDLYDVPLIGGLTKVLTFYRFEAADESIYIQMNVPELKNTGDSELESRINREVRLRVNEKMEEAKVRAKEFFDAYLATGGLKEEYIPMDFSIDYRINCQNDKYVSFTVSKAETQASYYEECDYYNIDMDTGSDLTLRDMLGENYIELCNEAVREGIAANERENPDDLYFHDEMGFQSIEPDQDFYINEAGHVVVVFPKYALAPGYMGTQEFEVLPPQ